MNEIVTQKLDEGDGSYWRTRVVGDGPWTNEPDKIQGVDEATGLAYLIVRHTSSGHLCGYVGVPSNHPCYMMDYSDVPVDVHGGLTYGSKCSGVICHVPQPGEPDDIYWLGFDCAHSMDLSPTTLQARSGSVREYRTISYVREECKKLAARLAQLG